MKTVLRWNRSGSKAALAVAAILACAVLIGCAPTAEKPGGQKKAETQKSDEPAAKQATSSVTETPAAPPEVPAKLEQPMAPPEPPATKSETPAAKSETPSKPEEPAAKPSEQPAAGGAAAAGEVKVSAFAPAEDLANQLDEYVKDLEKAVETPEEFKDSEGKVAKDSNTLIVITLALGLHEQPNRFKANAASIVKAAQELAKGAADYETAKKGVAGVKAAVEGKGPAGSELKWEKVAAMSELMKQVPLVNTKLKRYIQGSRFKSKAKDSAGFSAVIAAIGQGSVADTSVTKSDEEVKQWKAFCVQMRDAAGGVNSTIHAGDQAGVEVAIGKLAQSCDDCHAVFHKGEKSQKE
jgi:hypothetical protein